MYSADIAEFKTTGINVANILQMMKPSSTGTNNGLICHVMANIKQGDGNQSDTCKKKKVHDTNSNQNPSPKLCHMATTSLLQKANLDESAAEDEMVDTGLSTLTGLVGMVHFRTEAFLRDSGRSIQVTMMLQPKNHRVKEYNSMCHSMRLLAYARHWDTLTSFFFKVFPRMLAVRMANAEQKAFCVLQFARSESVVTVQCAFCIKLQCNPPTDNNIHRWYHQFEDTSCLHKGKTPRKAPVQKASCELAIPLTSVRRVLTKSLQLCPYCLQAPQTTVYMPTLQRKCCSMTMTIFLIMDESTFHLSGNVFIIMCTSEWAQKIAMRWYSCNDSQKFNVFCAISWRKVYGPFFFGEAIVTGVSYLDVLQQWLFPQLQDDEPENFIW
ncbi:hypothetical protein J437_LFUL019084 [Ladona fulva]|uniref:Uncharacterized protein n=1 Tax=Ladona fulva TaxID=123851 RepID=A0A8K0KT38_LADFU|nr:hypothetical protein J437_LFUL019084 [Ladona fulva]